jgi:hypothetical protein
MGKNKKLELDEIEYTLLLDFEKDGTSKGTFGGITQHQTSECQ